MQQSFTTKKSHQPATLFTESRFAPLPLVPDTKELEGQRFRRLPDPNKTGGVFGKRDHRKPQFLPAAIQNFLIPCSPWLLTTKFSICGTRFGGIKKKRERKKKIDLSISEKYKFFRKLFFCMQHWRSNRWKFEKWSFYLLSRKVSMKEWIKILYDSLYSL